jgi:hypothetical protein
MPEPYEKLTATTLESSIVRFSILEIPPSAANPVPMPDPFDRLDAFTLDAKISREPILEWPPPTP